MCQVGKTPSPLRRVFVFLCFFMYNSIRALLHVSKEFLMSIQNFSLTYAEILVIRQSLLLRQSQLRRSIDKETDSSIMAIRQEQFRNLDKLIDTFRLSVQESSK
jgi:hypothetical protein